MFNTYLFNTQQFNASLPVLSNVVDGLIVYGNYVLHDSTDVYASFTNADDMSTVEMDIFANPLDDWSTLSSYYLRGRETTIRGTITKDNAIDFNEELDNIKANLSNPWQMLSIKVNGVVRQATAYCSWLTFDRQHFNINYVRYTALFTITSEVWETVTYESTTVSTVSSTLQEEVINYGKYKAKPIIIITISSASSTNEITISMWGYTITLNETISDDDIIQINREDQTVTINGLEVDYVGMIPTLEIWRNPYTVTMNGTYQYDLTINYKKTFT